MPKIKTNRSVAKRFRLTAGGKVRRAHAFRRHLMSGKNHKRKRQLRRSAGVPPVEEKKIQQMLPYAS